MRNSLASKLAVNDDYEKDDEVEFINAGSLLQLDSSSANEASRPMAQPRVKKRVEISQETDGGFIDAVAKFAAQGKNEGAGSKEPPKIRIEDQVDEEANADKQKREAQLRLFTDEIFTEEQPEEKREPFTEEKTEEKREPQYGELVEQKTEEKRKAIHMRDEKTKSEEEKEKEEEEEEEAEEIVNEVEEEIAEDIQEEMVEEKFGKYFGYLH